jgi:RNA polymerase sigma-70 factor (ECF subfamily)
MPGGLPRETLREHLRALGALARRLTRDRAAADDAVQDTMVAALSQPAPHRAVRGWLAAVLRNFVRQDARAQRRRRRREAALPPADESPAAADVAAELLLHRRLVELVQELEPAVRQVLFLHFWRDLRPRAIAAQTGAPLATVYARLERGLARLRAQLDAEHGRRGAWVALLASLPQRPPLGLPPLVLLMKTKLLLSASLVIALAVLVPLLWRPDVAPVAAGAPAANPAAAAAAARGAAETAADRVAVAPPPAPAAVAATTSAPSFTGFVRDLRGDALADVAVFFEQQRGTSFARDPAQPSARSGHDGSFLLPVPAAAGWLTTDDPAWAPVRRAWLAGGAPAEPPVLVLAPARRYGGTVVDPDGAPVAGARVEVSFAEDLVPTRAVAAAAVALPNDFASVQTDAQGHFAIERLGFVPGALVIAEHLPFGAARLPLPEVATADLLLRLSAPSNTPRLFGVVVDARGRPVAGALVSVGDETATTGDDGRFAVAWLRGRRPTVVRAVRTGSGAASVAIAADPAQPGFCAERPLVLQLPDRTAALCGRVVDADGRPVAGAHVWTQDLTWLGNVTREEQGHQVSGGASLEGMATANNVAQGYGTLYSLGTATGADGTFVLDGLLDREYALQALASGTLCAAGPAMARPGAPVEMRLEAATLQRVAGRLVARDGTPLAGVHIGLGRGLAWQRPQRDDDPWAGSPTVPGQPAHTFHDGAVTTDADGRFAFAPLQPAGAFLWFDGDAVFPSEPFRLDGAGPLEHLEVATDARSTFRIELLRADEADAFAIQGVSGGHVPLFVRVEGYVMSMGKLDLVDGRAPEAHSRAGTVTAVLSRKGVEVRRFALTLPPGGVHVLRL